MAPTDLRCLDLITSGPHEGAFCLKPAKARIVRAGTPVCGLHRRAAEANGSATTPLTPDPTPRSAR